MFRSLVFGSKYFQSPYFGGEPVPGTGALKIEAIGVNASIASTNEAEHSLLVESTSLLRVTLDVEMVE